MKRWKCRQEEKRNRETKKTERTERKESREYFGIPTQTQNESETNLYSVGNVKPTIHMAGLDTK